MPQRSSDTGLPPGQWSSSPRVVILFGGSFDPPHRGHIELPLRAAQAVHADWLIYIPAQQSPHKHCAPGASGVHRQGMLQAALAGTPRCSVSDIELQRPPDEPSYTIKTLRVLRSSVPETVAFRLLIGADQAMALHRWREPGEIITLAEPMVMHRASDGSRDLLAEQLAALPAPVGASQAVWNSRIVDVPVIDASSTRVRALLRHGSDARARSELRRLVPEPVMRYIDEHGLYRDVPGA